MSATKHIQKAYIFLNTIFRLGNNNTIYAPSLFPFSVQIISLEAIPHTVRLLAIEFSEGKRLSLLQTEKPLGKTTAVLILCEMM